MSRRTTICVNVSAPPAKVFDVFERALSTLVLYGVGTDRNQKGGPFGAGEEFSMRIPDRGRMVEARCRVLARDPPNRVAWEIRDPSQSIAVEFRLRKQAHAKRPSTVAECSFELAPAGRVRRAMTLLFGRAIDRQLRRRVEVLKAAAEAGTGLPTGVEERDGPWLLAQRRYRGLGEYCAPGVHEMAARLLMEHVRTNAAVLDLGAGSGAWLARLRDAGFGTLMAVESNVEGFGLAGVVPRRLDLNTSFSDDFEERFGLITAIEIVEHLDSPRAFLRQVHRLLRDDGYALVTMPNVAHWAGRLKFLLRGEHRHFGEVDYAQRHISPVTNLHMHLMFREIGFRLVASARAGSFAGPLKRAVLAPVVLAFRALLGPGVSGEVAVYLVARSRPERSLGADSDYNRRIAQIWAPPRQADGR